MSTDDIPTQERADWYHDIIANTVAPTRMAFTNPATFAARAGVLNLEKTGVSRFSLAALQAWRTPRLIRQNDPEHYILALITGGAMQVSQLRNDTLVRPGEAVLFNTFHPYNASTASEEGAAFILLHIPRAAAPLPVDRLDEVLARPFITRQGIGAILRQFLTSLESHAPACTPHDFRLLDKTVLDLASGFLAHRFDAWETLSHKTRNRVLLQRIDAFIDRRLNDPALTPQAVADHHHISLRTLYTLFEQHGEGIAATIRHRRLERCRTDLTRPELAAYPIHAVARRWGFTNPTVFSRAFRHTYGSTPQDFRRQARQPSNEPATALSPPQRQDTQKDAPSRNSRTRESSQA
ncbi:AraC-like ligand-binding domain-containing protein [Streptomyces jumonjinensis]|uniref:AraC-like ligand-binding domain-containing protein n=1 Tax=Streptomyces jumonjinensis TaxID=1945 RepID=UPI003797D03F